MKPIGPYIIVDPAPEEVSKTEGGLLLTEKQGQVRYRKATVLATSDGNEIVNKDDVIYYDKHAGQLLDIEGIDYTIIQLRDIVVIM